MHAVLVTLVVALIIIFLIEILLNKKNKCEEFPGRIFRLNEDYLLNKTKLPRGADMNVHGIELIDTSYLFDGCGQDITNSNRLLSQLYGDNIDRRVKLFNKNDELLYTRKWTSINVCKGLNQDDIDYYGKNEAIRG